jgi:beta-lactamase superfamily II metal-dependent hydrolase
MPEVHLLTVGNGDCTLIRHGSDRVTMIDICGGNRTRKSASEKSAMILEEVAKAATANPLGNYVMCQKPTHPLDYIQDKGLSPIWRFISTHPDMDHLDGFDALLKAYAVNNFWHTGVQKPKPTFENCPYVEADWDCYVEVRDGKRSSTTSLKKTDGAKFASANKGDPNDHGDCLHIASPSVGLVTEADGCEEYNDSSYIIVYRMQGGKIVICGDAEDGAFNHAIEKYPDLMADVGFLLAPHHGRDSGRDYAFLDHLRPRFTLLGCAPHQHHRTSSWSSRELPYCKQNQSGNMVLTTAADGSSIDVYIQSKAFAKNSGGDTSRTLYDDLYFYRNI